MDNRSWEAGAAGVAPAVPAAPSFGYPTNGDPVTSIPATLPGAWWFHQIGEEIRNAIEAGWLTPDNTSNTQLITALRALFTQNYVHLKRGFSVVGNGVAFDDAGLNAGLATVAADGGGAYLPSSVYRLKRSLKLTKRRTHLTGESYQNTILKLDLVGADRGAWATLTNYAIDEVVTITDANGTAVPYICNISNLSGVFATDLAAGKWELWCCLSVEASDCTWDGILFDVPAKGVGAAVQGAARANPQNAAYVPRANNSGYGILLSDLDKFGIFSAGSYTHTVGPRNLIAVFTQGVRQFAKSIVSTGSGGGINATKFVQNHIVGDACIDIASGGGNTSSGNLFQSFSGANSGVRPYTSGIGYAIRFAGSMSCSENYFERFDTDLMPNSSSATFSSTGHHSDASNKFWPPQVGYPTPALLVSQFGVGAEILDGVEYYAVVMTGDNYEIFPTARFLNIQGGGASRSGCTISATSSQKGQRLTIFANSWAFEILHGGDVDLRGAGPRLILGQKGQVVGTYLPQGNIAEFILNDSGSWELMSHNWHSCEPGSYDSFSVLGNGATLTPTAETMMIAGNGAHFTGTLIAPGDRLGQSLTICGNSWAVGFAVGTAAWGAAGAPTFGNGTGQVLSMSLVYTVSGWYEKNRTVRP